MNNVPKRAPRANKFQTKQVRKPRTQPKLSPSQIAAIIHEKNLKGIPTRPVFGPDRVMIVQELRKLQGLPGVTNKKRLPTRRGKEDDVSRFERTNKKKVTAPCVTQPFAGVTALDITGFTGFCEHVVAHYQTGDLLINVGPASLMQYFLFVFFLYLEGTGSLLNAPFIPSGVRKIKLSVPYAVAKYMEYCGPYTKGLSANLKYEYVAADFPAAVFNNVGISQTFYPRPAYAVPWRFYPMTNPSALVQSTDTPGFLPQTTCMQKEQPYTFSFTDFLNQQDLISSISSALNRKGNTIPLSKVPQSAPDSTAYSRLETAVTTVYGLGGALSVDTNFDPELTSMFSPTLLDTVGYLYSTRKSTINPTFNYTGIPMGPYCQIASVCVFLAQTFQGPYKTGTFKKAFPYMGVKLDTLYPREQPISGNALSQIVQSSHSQLVANKTGDSGTDPVNQKLVLEAIIAFSCFQARMNVTEVCHYNSPAFEVFDETILQPQFNYCDAQWYSVNLTPEVAACISTIGPVVNAGQLVIPVSNYNFKTTGTAGNSAVGPQNWSAFGFTLGFDDYFAKNLLWSTKWGLLGTPTAFPNLIIDNTTVAVPCDQDYYELYYGDQILSLVSGEQLVCFTMCFNGGTGLNLLNQFNSWLISNQSTQQTPTAQVQSSLHGNFTVMTMTHTLTFADQMAASCQPIGVPGTPITSPEPGGSLQIVNGTADSVAFLQPTTVEDAFLAGVCPQGFILDQSSADPIDWTRILVWKQRIIKRIPAPVDMTDIPLSGPHTFNFPWSTGFGSLMQSVSNTLSNPVQSQWHKPLKNASAVGLSDPTVIDKFKCLLGSMAKQSFSTVPTSNVPIKQYVKESNKAKLGKFAGKLLKFGEGTAKKAENFGAKAVHNAEKAGEALE